MIQEAVHDGSKVDIGEIVLHHASDSYEIGLDGVFGNRLVWHWEKWPDIHIGGLAINLTPTKHTIFMILAAVLVFVTMKVEPSLLTEVSRSLTSAPGWLLVMPDAE